MKVYELMERIAKAPAGAEVYISLVITAGEFTDNIIEDGVSDVPVEDFDMVLELSAKKDIESYIRVAAKDTNVDEGDFTIYCEESEG